MSSSRKTTENIDTADWLNDHIDPKGDGTLLKPKNKRSGKPPVSRYNLIRYSLLGILLTITMVYIGSDNRGPSAFSDGVSIGFNSIDEGLIERMGTWMTEMGYGDLTREQLIELREAGVTATYTSRMRELGYVDLTLDELKRLSEAGVTETFAGMMHELGYNDLTKEDLILLKQRGLTADFTARVQNAGYPDITKEDLIRLKNYNVTLSFIESAKTELGETATIDDIIRYKIRNQ